MLKENQTAASTPIGLLALAGSVSVRMVFLLAVLRMGRVLPPLLNLSCPP
jgi:hypothetical protein